MVTQSLMGGAEWEEKTDFSEWLWWWCSEQQCTSVATNVQLGFLINQMLSSTNFSIPSKYTWTLWTVNDVQRWHKYREWNELPISVQMEQTSLLVYLSYCTCGCSTKISMPLQVLDDPSGNSFIENPLAPDVDPLLSVDYYTRTHEQDVQLGALNDSCDNNVRFTCMLSTKPKSYHGCFLGRGD